MPYDEILVGNLRVNQANDRHGELENETAAIGELFRLRETHMRNLATDITNEAGIYDPPLVTPENGEFTVFDGNRRITCLKLIIAPQRAPSQDLQIFFQGLHDRWRGELPTSITCQVETDRDIIDAILFRRHTGSQGGVGQSDWDDRAKRNFIERTGRGGRLDVAVEVERFLRDAGQLPVENIPRSTMNRLLSSEVNRRRVGISVEGNRFRLTHDPASVSAALARIASDLSRREVVLGHLWNNEGKRTYLNRLEAEGVLPREDAAVANQNPPQVRRAAAVRRGRPPMQPQPMSFIPADVEGVAWRGDQGRIRAIWDELRTLGLNTHPNAISALIRILLELVADSYIHGRNLGQHDNLSQKIRACSNDLLGRAVIDQAYHDEIERMRQHSELISIRSMQRYVHSDTFAPLPNELSAYWIRLGRFITACLNH